MKIIDKIKNLVNQKENKVAEEPEAKTADYGVIGKDENKYVFVADIISSLNMFSTEEEIQEAFEIIEKLPSQNKFKDYNTIARWFPNYLQYIPEIYKNKYDEKLDFPILYKTIINACPTNVKYIPASERNEELLCFTIEKAREILASSTLPKNIAEREYNTSLIKVIDSFPGKIKENDYFFNIKKDAINSTLISECKTLEE